MDGGRGKSKGLRMGEGRWEVGTGGERKRGLRKALVEAGHGHLQHVDSFISIFSQKILLGSHIRNRLLY